MTIAIIKSNNDVNSDSTKLLNTLQASDYLHSKYGYKISRKTLEKSRVTGEGPTFQKIRHKVSYRPQDLDAWLFANTKSLESTSQNIRPPGAV